MTAKFRPTERLWPFRAALLLTLFSVLGWCWEMAVEWAVRGHPVHRGFSTGPWLPIYGFGLLLIAGLWRGYLRLRPGAGAGELFLLSGLSASAAEWATSWVMERLLHRRWWDYGAYPPNLDGRVCLYSALLLGLGGVLGVRVLLPRAVALLDRLSPLAENYLGLGCALVVSLDFLHALSGVLA